MLHSKLEIVRLDHHLVNIRSRRFSIFRANFECNQIWLLGWAELLRWCQWFDRGSILNRTPKRIFSLKMAEKNGCLERQSPSCNWFLLFEAADGWNINFGGIFQYLSRGDKSLFCCCCCCCCSCLFGAIFTSSDLAAKVALTHKRPIQLEPTPARWIRSVESQSVLCE